MEELKARFPDGVDYSIVYDTTPFIEESVNEVFHALRDAVILVAIVVLVFLQGWRAAVIPLVAVPVAVIGTFAAMAACGFSLNTLTLFGLVLAIGIVVDDAIVVVEAVEHHIEEGLLPRDAAIKAMDEVSGPVIAVGLVLSAVFIPCTFITGIVGQFFRQFAVTIAISTVISTVNSLTLSPALAVLLLKPKHQGHGDALPRPGLIVAAGWAAFQFLPSYAGEWLHPWLVQWLPKLPVAMSEQAAVGCLCVAAGLLGGALLAGLANRLLAWFFRIFNLGFGAVTAGYVGSVGGDAPTEPGRAAGLWRIALLHVRLLRFDTDRLHSAAGQGLFAGQRAVARFCFAGADRASHAADRKNSRPVTGREAYRGHRRPIGPVRCQCAEFRHHVRHARRLSSSSERSPVGRRDCRSSSKKSSKPRFRKA